MNTETSDNMTTIKASQMRAALIGFFNRNATKEHSVDQIQADQQIATLMVEIGYDRKKLAYTLVYMAKNLQISKRLFGISNWYAPIGFHSHKHAEELGVAQTSKVYEAAKKQPAIQIDIIKSTGKVRITTQGICIEIGVAP